MLGLWEGPMPRQGCSGNRAVCTCRSPVDASTRPPRRCRQKRRGPRRSAGTQPSCRTCLASSVKVLALTVATRVLLLPGTMARAIALMWSATTFNECTSRLDSKLDLPGTRSHIITGSMGCYLGACLLAVSPLHWLRNTRNFRTLLAHPLKWKVRRLPLPIRLSRDRQSSGER